MITIQNVKFMLDETFNKYQTQENNRTKTIVGVPNYDILMNPEYTMAFQYIPAFAHKRDILIQDGDKDESNDYQTNDIPRLTLNLAMQVDRANYESNFEKKKFNLDTAVAKSTQIN